MLDGFSLRNFIDQVSRSLVANEIKAFTLKNKLTREDDYYLKFRPISVIFYCLENAE